LRLCQLGNFIVGPPDFKRAGNLHIFRFQIYFIVAAAAEMAAVNKAGFKQYALQRFPRVFKIIYGFHDTLRLLFN